MKTCYGLQCYEYKESRELGSMGLSSFKTFLVIVAIVAILFVATEVLNDVSLANYLTNGFINDFPNSDYINRSYMP